MSRELDVALDLALGQTTLRGVYLAEFVLDDETIRVFTGTGAIAWAGHKWIGMGLFGKVGQVEETADGKETGATYELSGLPRTIPGSDGDLDLLQVFRAVEIQGRTVSLWFGALNEAMAAIDGIPALSARGMGDQVQITDDGEAITIRVTTENRSRGQVRSVRRVYSDADQQAEYPGDTMFAQMPALVNSTLVWGRKDEKSPGEKAS